MPARRLFASVISLFLALPLAAQDAPKKWTYTAEASLVNANGNTKSLTTSAKNNLLYQRGRVSQELGAGGLGAQSQGTTTAEQYFAFEKTSFKFTDRNYVFERFGWDRDRFAGVAHRYDASLGVGRDLVSLPRHMLSVELGGGYINEQRTTEPRNDFASGRAFTKYQWTLSDTANFLQTAEYIGNFEDGDDFRAQTETALTAALSEHFSMKTSFIWKHVGQPPAGFLRNDTVTTVALVASY